MLETRLPSSMTRDAHIDFYGGFGRHNIERCRVHDPHGDGRASLSPSFFESLNLAGDFFDRIHSFLRIDAGVCGAPNRLHREIFRRPFVLSSKRRRATKARVPTRRRKTRLGFNQRSRELLPPLHRS